jgi:hypothetical protein
VACAGRSIGLAVTVLKDTVGELPAFVALYRRLGLDGGINLQPLNPMPGYRTHYDPSLAGQMISDREFREHVERLRAEPVYGIALDGTASTRGFFDELFAGFEPSRRVCPWLERGAFVTADGWVTPCCTIKDGEKAGFGKVGEATPAQLDAARRALAAELGEGRTPAPCQGCAIAAMAIAEPGVSTGPIRWRRRSLSSSSSPGFTRAGWPSSATSTAGSYPRSRTRSSGSRISVAGGKTRGRPPTELAELRSRLEAAQEARARLAAEVEASHARIAALRDSWSWRLAAPLRAGHRLLGLGRG